MWRDDSSRNLQDNNQTYLDDRVEKLLGLAGRFDDVISLSHGVIIGVVRTLAFIPLRHVKKRGGGEGEGERGQR